MSSLSSESYIDLPLPTVALAEQMIAPVGKRAGPGHGDGWYVPSGERLRLAREIHGWGGNGVSLAPRQLDPHDIGRARDGPAACSLVAEARQTLEEVLDYTRRPASGWYPRRRRDLPGGTGADSE